MSKRYFGNWSDHQSMVSSFLQGEWNYEKEEYEKREIPDDFPKDHEVLFATYDYGSYSGSAIIIYVRDGQLFIAEPGHCSCNGLEECSPVGGNTSWASLRKRFTDGWISLGDDADQETRGALEKLIHDSNDEDELLKAYHQSQSVKN